MYPDSIIKDSTKRTPRIILQPGRIFIMGRSIPENPGEFYRPVLEWLAEYVVKYKGKSKIDIGFEYINTSSTKWIYTILKELSGLNEICDNASVTWYFEQGDDDMGELGFILRSLLECPFLVVEVNEMSSKKYEQILSGQK
ncbi:MAG: DUF1987 domain-containing protein [Bacteroidales bacterium]|nr:DUF1987 domain-containing protein [Bacteroidales bacterium]MBK7625817.1 DUF1987 domain-containing protein [Bacteroidales bacterium]